MEADRPTKASVWLTASLIAGFFALDLWLPNGYPVSLSYVLPQLVTFWSGSTRFKISVAGTCTVLLILGTSFPIERDVAHIVAANRCSAVFAIWITAFLSVRWTKIAEALRESDFRFRQLADNVDAVLWMTSADGRQLLYISPAHERMSGRSRQSLYEDPASWIEAIHPEDRERVRQAFFSAAQTGKFEEEYRSISADGTERWIHDRGFAVFEEGSRVARIVGISTDVTARRRAELELRASRDELERRVAQRTLEMQAATRELKRRMKDLEEAKAIAQESQRLFREQLEEVELLYQTAPVGLCFVDTDLRFLRMNERMAALNGSSHEQYVGRTMRETLPEMAKRLEPIFQKVIQTAEPVIHHEIQESAADSTVARRIWLASCYPLKTKEGLARGVNVVLEDITGLRKTERKLYLTQRSVDGAADTIFWLGPDGRFLYANNAASRLYGYPLEELLQLSVHDIDSAISPRTWPRQWRFVKQQGSVTFESSHRCKDGRVFPAEVTVTYLEFDGKEYHFAYVRDITRRKQSEEALRENEARLKAILENAVEAIISIDEKGTIEAFNPSAERLFGYAAGEATGHNVGILMPSPHRERHNDYMASHLETGKKKVIGVSREVIAQHKDGTLFPVHLAVGEVLLNGRHIFTGIVHDMTEHKRAEEQLRESEERFRQLAENIDDVFRITAPGAKELIYISPACEKIWGHSPQLLFENLKSWLETIHPEDREKVRETFFDREISSQVSVEYRIVRPDGSIRWIHDRGFAVRDEEGRVYRIAGIAADITGRKEAELALWESEERFRIMANSAPVLLWMADADGLFTFFNDRWLLFTGRTLEQESGQGWVEKVHRDDAPSCLETCLAALEARRQFTSEFRLRREDGEYRWILNIGAPRWRPDGVFAGYVGTGVDITDFKRSQKALQRSETRFRRLFESNIIGVFFADPDGIIKQANDAFLRMVGYTAEDVAAGKLRWQTVTPADWQAVDAEVFQKLKQRQPAAPYKKEYLRKDGVRIPALVGRALLDESGTEMVCFALDIAEKERAEQQIRQYMEDLQKAKELSEQQAADLAVKNAELEQFANIASHDLQEPLRSVAGYAQLLARRYGDRLDSDGEEFIAYIVEGANRMQQMINDLLAYSRAGTRALDLDSVDCKDCVIASLENLKQAMEEAGAAVESDPLPTLPGDRSRLIQLFQNLIGNAVKYRGESPPRVKIEAKAQGDQWVFSVRDNGIGMDPRYRDRIFKMFQRLHTRKEYSGTGVGLAICKKIVERHGGRIWVESKPGRGATFYFTLPKENKTVPCQTIEATE